MSKRIALAVLAALLGACTTHPGKDQNTVNEASTTTGTGNTAGSFVAPGPNANSQGAKENARR